MNVKAIKARECIFKTNQFAKSFGSCSFIVLEGSIEIIEHIDDVAFRLYHIRLNPGAIVLHYRANEEGIRSARLYHNPDEPSDKPTQAPDRMSLALSQY